MTEWLSFEQLLVALSIFVLATVILSAAVFFGRKRQLELHNERESLVAKAQLLEQQSTKNHSELAVAESRLESALTTAEQHANQIQQNQLKIDSLKEELSVFHAEKVQLQTQLKNERIQSQEKLQLLEQAKDQLTEQFENLANKIFESKTEKFNQQSKQTMSVALDPLKDQLKEFKSRMDSVHTQDLKDRQSLLTEISQLKNLNNQLSQDAHNLTKALKGEKKTQGNWGEVVLEKVLENSGLRKGYEYDTQVHLKSEEGKRRAPDVIVRLPEEKDVVVDSKVSLVDFEQYVSAETEEERLVHIQNHVAAVKKHIKDLSSKNYEKLEGIRTLDFVLLFIPIEAAFLSAIEFDPGVFTEAYDKNIIVVSPSTLLATLRTIESIWRYERQNKNAEAIAKQAGALHDQLALVIESLTDVGKHIERSQDAYDKTLNRLSQGKGNLVRRVNQLEELGAKTKKALPKDLLEELS